MIIYTFLKGPETATMKCSKQSSTLPGGAVVKNKRLETAVLKMQPVVLQGPNVAAVSYSDSDVFKVWLDLLTETLGQG